MFNFAKKFVRSAEEILSQSNNDSYNDQGSVNFSGNQGTNPPAYGFRVVHVDQNSAAREGGIESLFDFIIGLNGHDLYSNQIDHQNIAITEDMAPIDSFLQEISNCRGRSVSFEVWSAKGRVQRTIQLAVPEVEQSLIEQEYDSGTGATGGDAASTTSTTDHYQRHHDRNQSYSSNNPVVTFEDFGLGLTLQWTPLEVADHVWHVLNVSPNSPAERAGLISHADYIVAAEKGLLESGGESLLARVVSRMINGYYTQYTNTEDAPPPPEIELYVYNHDYDTVRPVRIQPNPNWGGSGLLGCGVGYGLLHRLPLVVGKFSPNPSRNSGGTFSGRNRNSLYSGIAAPGDTLFEVNQEDEQHQQIQEDTSNFITPASLANAAPHIASIPPPPRGNRRHHAHSVSHQNQPAADLSGYFAEEEQRSRELEGNRSTPVNSNKDLPPPPPPPPPPAKK